MVIVGLYGLAPSTASATCDWFDPSDPRYTEYDCVAADPKIEPSPDDASPPILGGAVECQTAIAVSGAAPGATVRIYLGLPGASVLWGSGTSEGFPLEIAGAALDEGDILYATQQRGSDAVSDPSNVITVAPLPDPLPPPRFYPFPVYDCSWDVQLHGLIPGSSGRIAWETGWDTSTPDGDVIALWTDEPASYMSATLPLGLPWFEDEGPPGRLTGKYNFCGSSAEAIPESAISVTHALPALSEKMTILEPVFAGQRYVPMRGGVHGALLSLHDATDVVYGSTGRWWTQPVDWAGPGEDGFFRMIAGEPVEGRSLQVSQVLCDVQGAERSPIFVQPCEDAPPPLIRTPIPGESFVQVVEGLPGARINVFALVGSTFEEIGEGSGPEVRLTRALHVGETLRVRQYLDECSGEYDLAITVPCTRREEYEPPAAGLYNVESVHITRDDDITGYEYEYFSFDDDPLVARIYYPAQPGVGGLLRSLGPLPVVLAMVGNNEPHLCPTSGSVCGWTCTPGATAYCGPERGTSCGHDWWDDEVIPNEDAFDTVATHLASHGYAVIVISPNAICETMNPAPHVNISYRAALFRAAIQYGLDGSIDPHLSGVSTGLDWEHVALLGHSRSAEAAVNLANDVDVPGADIAAVMALAPTDLGMTRDGMLNPPTVIDHIPTLIVLAARDNDTGNRGNGIYDRSPDAAYRALMSIASANHAFFTDIWQAEAGSPGGDLPATNAQQTAVTADISLGHFDYILGRSPAFASVLDGESYLVPEAGYGVVRNSRYFEPLSTYTSSLGTNDAGGSTVIAPAFTSSARTYCGGSGSPFRGNTFALWLQWAQAGNGFEENAPSGFGGANWLSFRAAQIHFSASPLMSSSPLIVDVHLTDGSTTRVISSGEAGFIPGLYGGFLYEGDDPVSQWGMVRIPLACALEGLDNDDLTAGVTFNDRSAGYVAIDDFMLE